MDINKVLYNNYLPYAHETIINRALPDIDGLKPVHRKILYTMYSMGLLNGGKTKSANIVGQTMKLHPHGDGAIYDTLTRLANGSEVLNLPYIESKGNFGKVYSRDMAYAAPRYTEAKLADICKELFDGIHENAVEMLPNYDGTCVEPYLLPVKFPSIIVNTQSGIAVAKSSYIPSYGLIQVCDATIGLIKGDIVTHSELAAVLGVPQFSTGGFIHCSREELINLVKYGKGTLTMTADVEVYSNRLIVNKIPYRTTVETIKEQITERIKTGELSEVKDVVDEIDINGFGMTIELKNGSNSSVVLKKLYKYTDMMMKISFNTQFIIKNMCVNRGIKELLEDWIDFRKDTIRRIYEYRLDKKKKLEHLLSAWELAGDNIKEIAVKILESQDDNTATKILMGEYKMSREQADYILDEKNRNMTIDNVHKKKDNLIKLRKEIDNCLDVLNDKREIENIIIDELNDIKNKYKIKNETIQSEPIDDNELNIEEVEDTTEVVVVLTKNYYIKRLTSDSQIQNVYSTVNEGDEIIKKWITNNNKHILVFLSNGKVLKVKVSDINAGRGIMKDTIKSYVNIESYDEIINIDSAGDYTGRLIAVYETGRGEIIKYEKFVQNRKEFVNIFDSSKGDVWVTDASKFFVITKNRKAAYVDVTGYIEYNCRTFKAAIRKSDDIIHGLQPIENVPNMDIIDVERYSKGYFVSIKKDKLW